ncbi:MAG: hypothetical protein J6P60_07060, partial [Lachnospiraceae bacterium]|nr:hypothetical protein [Lachnospiraceae bacterium]
CGIFVPQWLLGVKVLTFAKFMPFYWSTYALNMVYPECGAGLSFDRMKVLQCYGIELLFAIVFTVLAVMVRRAKVERG